MNVVFVLGAGASRHMRAPIMAEFFEAAENLASANKVKEGVRASFDAVRVARSSLQATLAKARFDIRNLETVFAAFEMAELLGLESSMLHATELVASLRRVIATTLEERMRFPVSGQSVASSSEYDQLVRIATDLVRKGWSPSFLTFNYDLGLDVAIHNAKRGVDYGLEAWGDPSREPLELLKLHGSLNWFRCTKCPAFVIQPVRDVLSDAMRARARLAETDSTVCLRPRERPKRSAPLAHCEVPVEPEPYLVPPTLQKLGEQRLLHSVWKKAAERLKAAEYIAIIGYSWPQNDQFFHQLFALGATSDVVLRRVIVLDPSQATIDRIGEQMLGEDTRMNCMRPIKGDFGRSALDQLAKDLG